MNYFLNWLVINNKVFRKTQLTHINNLIIIIFLTVEKCRESSKFHIPCPCLQHCKLCSIPPLHFICNFKLRLRFQRENKGRC